VYYTPYRWASVFAKPQRERKKAEALCAELNRIGLRGLHRLKSLAGGSTLAAGKTLSDWVDPVVFCRPVIFGSTVCGPGKGSYLSDKRHFSKGKGVPSMKRTFLAVSIALVVAI